MHWYEFVLNYEVGSHLKICGLEERGKHKGDPSSLHILKTIIIR